MLAVFIGGGVGSVFRFLIGRAFSNNEHWFYFGTFAANMLSSLVLGYLVALSFRNAIGEQTQLLLMAGFCGGFSTFSTFSLENYQLLEDGNFIGAIVYAGSSILLGLLCVYFGIKIGTT